MLKKILTFAIVLVVAFALIGCAVPEGEQMSEEDFQQQQQEEELNPFEEEDSEF
ncbi:hypothetical protein [Halonatronum saccharophilum]|uniref:hypothetical protein n=1 Tax=Halonatronum saccharophilum TaxID=150060 RepID=UPI0004AD84FA|nr:hypothetical protein [Halonatronum saccharophilum]